VINVNDTTLGLVSAAVPLLIIGFLILRRLPWIFAFFVALLAVGLGYLETTGAVRDFGHKVRIALPQGIVGQHHATETPATEKPAEAPAMTPASPPAEAPAMAPASPPAESTTPPASPPADQPAMAPATPPATPPAAPESTPAPSTTPPADNNQTPPAPSQTPPATTP
jgi:hypothetical protein